MTRRRAADEFEWDCFLWSADEWIVNYAMPVHPMLAVKLFSIGHALELYLKATHSKLSGSVPEAIAFRHRLPQLLAACKTLDPAFLRDWELRDTVLKRDLLDLKDYMQLPRADLESFLRHQELYVVAKHLADLKYAGAPWKGGGTSRGSFLMHTHPMWSALFREIRQYLEYPRPGRTDPLRYYLEDGKLPPSAAAFLREILA